MRYAICLISIVLLIGLMPFVSAGNISTTGKSSVSKWGNENQDIGLDKSINENYNKNNLSIPNERTSIISTNNILNSHCYISDKLLKDYNQLLIELREVELKDKEKSEKITKKIIALKQEIKNVTEKCDVELASIHKAGILSSNSTEKLTSICDQIEQTELKYAFYKEIYLLSDKEIKNKGYSGKEEIWKILAHLSEEILKIEKICGEEGKIPTLECKHRVCPDGLISQCEKKIIEKCGVNTFSIFNKCDNNTEFRNIYFACYDGFEKMGTYSKCKSSSDLYNYATDFCKGHCKKIEICVCPVCKTENVINTSMDFSGFKVGAYPTGESNIIDSSEGIRDYYKSRIKEISFQDNDSDQIRNLTLLREEIDNLILDLIRKRDVISKNDFDGMVEEINISAGEIKADTIQVKTIGKKVLIDINNIPISVEPTEKHVLIKDENLIVEASTVSIQDDAFKVGNAQVKIAPSEVIEKLNITPKYIGLKEENSTALYEIKTEEMRKLVGFIPVKIDRYFTIDAKSNELIKEYEPWYTFLTIK